MYDAIDDPYTYENSTVLVNKLDLRDQDELDAFEAEISNARSGEPLPGASWILALLRCPSSPVPGRLRMGGNPPHGANVKAKQSILLSEHIEAEATKLFAALKADRFFENLGSDDFSSRAAHFLSELNVIHAFREGNGRTQLTFFAMLADNSGHPLNLEKLDSDVMLSAMIEGFEGDEQALAHVIKSLIT